MAEYTMLDECRKCVRVNLDQEPLIVKRCYVVGRYEVAFEGDTDLEAVQKMEQWAAENTPFRGFAMIAKHLGFYDLFVDEDGRRFLHGFYDGRGRFRFVHDGIEFSGVDEVFTEAKAKAEEQVEKKTDQEQELGIG